MKLRVLDDTQLPAVFVTLNETHKVWLGLATGVKAGITLDQNYANSLKVETINNALTIDTLKFGPYELGNISTQIATIEESESIRNSKRRVNLGSHIDRSIITHGLIGYEVLKHFVLTMDLDTEKLHVWLPPSKKD